MNKVLVGENPENSNQKVLTWLTNHFDRLSARRISSLSIDHTVHDGAHPRGASVKSFYMDVQISQTSEGFNRREAGIVNLHMEKDRHGYFDNNISVLLGGTPFTSEIKPQDEIKPEGKTEKTVDPILSYLRENGPATNREISDRAQINLKTITNQTGRLLNKEVIQEVGTSDDGLRIYDLA